MNTTARPRAVVRVMGGLGNQLFQIAHALDLRARGTDVTLDVGWFRRHGRPAGRTLDAEPVFADLPVLGRLRSDLLTLRMAWRRPSASVLDTTIIIGRTSVHVGYWQDAAMVDRVRADLQDRLRYAVGYNAESAERSECVAVHVRQGDHADPATRAFHGLTDPIQQLQIADRLRSELGVARIEVFTDSRDAVAPILDEFTDVTINTAQTSWETLRGLSQSRGLVMSNSSLSWWAATLAGWCASPPPAIACPHPWLAEPSPLDALASHRWRMFLRSGT